MPQDNLADVTASPRPDERKQILEKPQTRQLSKSARLRFFCDFPGCKSDPKDGLRDIILESGTDQNGPFCPSLDAIGETEADKQWRS